MGRRQALPHFDYPRSKELLLGRIALLLAASLLLVQQPGARRRGPPRPNAELDDLRPASLKRHEFYFTRAAYGGGGWRSRSWTTDYPKADRQFLMGVGRILQFLDSSPDEHPMRLDDPELRRFPFLYAVEVGYMSLTEPEVQGLRSYLLAGGFLIADDFWGTAEWANFESELRRVLPEFPHLVKTVTVTTRPRKEGEQHGRDYFFVTSDEFQRLIAAGELLEWAQVHGHYYGSPKQWVQEQLAQGRSVVLVIDVQGGLNVKAQCPDAVLVFVRPPRGREREVLLQRIAGRGRDDEAEVQTRLKTAEWELMQADRYDYQIVNEDLEEATQQLRAILQKEINAKTQRCEDAENS